MKYCRSKATRFTYMLLWGGTLFILSTLLWKRSIVATDNPGVWNFFCCIFSGYVLLSSLLLLWQSRKYTLSKEGIAVAYIPKLAKLIPWGSISEVAICKMHYHTKTGWETVIRIAAGSELEGPSHGEGKWNQITYSITYQDRIIIIDYSEAKLEEFKAVCPLPIRDYR